MTAPKVELKNIKFHEGMEGQGFNADLWINGVNCMHVRDSGDGGELDSRDNIYKNPKADIVRENIKQLNVHIASLPDYVYPARDGQRELRIKIDLAIFVEELLNKMAKEKEAKKIAKLQLDNILWGQPNGSSYMKMKLVAPIKDTPADMLSKTVAHIRAIYFKTGDVFLNTNFAEFQSPSTLN